MMTMMTTAIRQSLPVDSLAEWHDRKYSLYCLLRPTISNIFMIILLTNCAAIKKVIVVKSSALGLRWTHAIPRLALAPSVSPFRIMFPNTSYGHQKYHLEGMLGLQLLAFGFSSIHQLTIWSFILESTLCLDQWSSHAISRLACHV